MTHIDHEIIHSRLYHLIKELVEDQGVNELCIFECLTMVQEILKPSLIEKKAADAISIYMIERLSKETAHKVTRLIKKDGRTIDDFLFSLYNVKRDKSDHE